MPYTRSRTRSNPSAWGRGLAAFLLCAATLAGPEVALAAGQPLGHAKVADLRGEAASPEVRHVADWAVDSGDSGGLPFVIVDKLESRVFVFDGNGRLRGASPALVGAARGDATVPGIGERAISSILPEERTTPAGRFTAVMGQGPKGEDILWVDYDSALALHRVVTNVPQERRLQRLQSKVPAERRITYGCINVPVAFYEAVVRPAFAGTRGIVYILPEASRPQEVFGSYEVRQPLSHASARQPHALH
jgi:hypothetical protein